MIFIWQLVIHCLKHVEFSFGSNSLYGLILSYKNKVEISKSERWEGGSLLLWIKKVI